MFCSGCGTENSKANAYCKRCGEWMPDVKSPGLRKKLNASPEQSVKTVLFASGLSAWFALFSSLALFIIFFSKHVNWNNILLAATFCLAIAMYQIGIFINGLKLRQRIKRGRAEEASQIPEQDDPHLLKPPGAVGFFEAGSVTENTTELLEPLPLVQRQQRKESAK